MTGKQRVEGCMTDNASSRVDGVRPDDLFWEMMSITKEAIAYLNWILVEYCNEDQFPRWDRPEKFAQIDEFLADVKKRKIPGLSETDDPFSGGEKHDQCQGRFTIRCRVK